MYYDKRTEVEPAPVKHREYTAVQQSCLEAAEYIRTHGWCQGTYQNHLGMVCMIGSAQVRGASVGDPVYYHMVKFLGGISPISWNDSRNRTKEQVIAALEMAAEMEE